MTLYRPTTGLHLLNEKMWYLWVTTHPLKVSRDCSLRCLCCLGGDSISGAVASSGESGPAGFGVPRSFLSKLSSHSNDNLQVTVSRKQICFLLNRQLSSMDLNFNDSLFSE